MSKKIIYIIIVTAILMSMVLLPAAASGVEEIYPENVPPAAEPGEAVDETAHLWFVELNSPPTADGTPLATVKAEKAAFRANAKKANLNYTERFAFDTLFNGLSVEVGSSSLGKLSRIAGVKNTYPVEIIPVPESTLMENPDLATALAMTGADGPGGGGAARGRQRLSAHPGVKPGQHAKTCASSADGSAAPSPLAG